MKILLILSLLLSFSHAQALVNPDEVKAKVLYMKALNLEVRGNKVAAANEAFAADEADHNYRKAALHYKDLIQRYPNIGLADVARKKLKNLPTKIKRYLVYSDGMANDTVTGLTWMRCSVGQTWTGSGCSGQAKELNLDDAQKQIANFAGFSDWRIPTIKELRSLVYCSNGQPDYFSMGKNADGNSLACVGNANIDFDSPTIVQAVFPNTPSDSVWSASPYKTDLDYTWVMFFGNGDDDGSYRLNERFVRLVRGGQ